MASSIHKLSAAFVSRANRSGRFNDGLGLYLQCSKIGKRVTKAWLLRFKLNGRKREMGLGSVHIYSLREARERVRCYRQLIDQGIDPIEHRKTQRAAAVAEAAKQLTFAEAASGFLKDNRNGWRNGKNVAQWESSLRDYVLPALGALSVASIETAHVVKTLRPIWEAKTVTAGRVRQRIEAVLNWATAGGFRQGENPARWKGHLANILPKRQALAPVEHHAALAFAAMPAFMTRLAALEGLPARALETLVLTAVRTGELLGARWDEFDLTGALWTIPASRTKTNRAHRVPLSPRVITLLQSLPNPEASSFVFPSRRGAGRTPLHLWTLRKALHAIEPAEQATLHGFRSTFRDWCGDHSTAGREIAEAALGHAVGDTTERAYRRSDALAKRRRLMREWADFCCGSRDCVSSGLILQ
jgi:integrase